VVSAKKRDKGRMFELLLLLAIYVRPAFGVGRGKCGAIPIRGVAGGGGGRPEPKKGSWSC